MQEAITNPILQATIELFGKIMVPVGFLLNAGKWLIGLNINAWLAAITGALGLIYLVYKIYNAHLDTKIKKHTLKNLKNGVPE